MKENRFFFSKRKVAVSISGMLLISLLMIPLGLLFSHVRNFQKTPLINQNILGFAIGVSLYYFISYLGLFCYYTLFSRKRELLIINDKNCRFKNGNKTINFTFDDIREIMVYYQPWKYKRRDFSIGIMIDSFHYAKFVLKDGQQFIVTSLLQKEVWDFFPGHLVKMSWRLLPLPSCADESQLMNMKNTSKRVN